MRSTGFPASTPYAAPDAHAPSNTASKGVVRWFNDEKGYGFIRPDSGDDAFVHFKSIINQNGRRTLKEGQHVRFDVIVGPKGLAAVNVEVLG
jgi:CspA family cold shock protein